MADACCLSLHDTIAKEAQAGARRDSLLAVTTPLPANEAPTRLIWQPLPIPASPAQWALTPSTCGVWWRWTPLPPNDLGSTE